MKISIALATYNGSDFILPQLNSFLNQTLQPDEVVVSDDNSNDDTVSLINDFAVTAPFNVKVFVNDNTLGYAGNFNVALIQTTGDLVFLSDQDDVWFPEKLQYMVSVAVKEPNYFIYMNDALLTDSNLNSVDLTKFQQIKSAGFSSNSFVMGCCCAIRREFLDFVLPIPVNVKAHDNWLVEIADCFDAKLIDPTVLQFYRRHGKNESQFIANSLFKVNKLDRIWQVLNFSLRSKNHEDFSKSIENMYFFINGLNIISPNVPFIFKDKFSLFIDSKQQKLDLAKKRLEIRQSFITKRVFMALKLYLNGYPKNSRFELMIRDILS
jgi:glycosyltransferase involved in cell wall biosynthesis